MNMNDSCDQKSSCNLVRKVPPFLLKTYMLVEDPGSDEVISWNGEGTAFVVWQPADFSRDLLPTLFKHSNFSSFVRQLNTYGFRKVATNRWEFSNHMFRKGQRDKLCQIRRRRKPKAKAKAAAACSNNNTPPTKDRTISSIDHSSDDEDDINIELDQICRSSSSSSSDHELLLLLIHDNKKLKQENQVLSSHLALMKKKCKQLVDLVAINHGSPPNSSHIIIEEEDQEEEEECVDDQYQLLQEKINIINSTTTSSSDIHDQGPKLFGVRLINTSSSHQEKGIFTPLNSIKGHPAPHIDN